jgi:hypothetical protein
MYFNLMIDFRKYGERIEKDIMKLWQKTLEKRLDYREKDIK